MAQQCKDLRRLYVLSDAGKPIWTSTDQSEVVIAPLMGVVTAVLGFVSMNQDCLKAVVTNTTTTVVIVRGAIVLLVTSTVGDSEAFLAFLLETLYHQILFSLTSLVQRKLKMASSFDMRNLLGGTEPVMHALANNAFNQAGLMTCSVRSLEIDISVRKEAGRVLTWAQSQVPEIFYAILLVGDRILTVLQPTALQHRIDDLDLYLIINFVNSQKAFHGTESWTPLCLPKFNSNGFLNGYIGFLDEESDLCLLFISSQQKLETFLIFQEFAKAVHTSLLNDSSIDKIRKAKKETNEQKFLTQNLELVGNSEKQDELSRPLHYVYIHKPIIKTVRSDTPREPSISQFLSPETFTNPLKNDNETAIAKYWTLYQNSILRLRHCSCDLEVTMQVPYLLDQGIENPIASLPWRTKPQNDFCSYSQNNILIIGFCNDQYEIHALFHSSVSPSNGLLAVQRLAANIDQNSESLFLLKPPVY